MMQRGYFAPKQDALTALRAREPLKHAYVELACSSRMSLLY